MGIGLFHRESLQDINFIGEKYFLWRKCARCLNFMREKSGIEGLTFMELSVSPSCVSYNSFPCKGSNGLFLCDFPPLLSNLEKAKWLHLTVLKRESLIFARVSNGSCQGKDFKNDF